MMANNAQKMKQKNMKIAKQSLKILKIALKHKNHIYT